MELWLILIILGLITYYIVQRSITNITHTPVWLCWLVMMTPAFIWSGWSAFFGQDKPLPLILALGPFVICPLLYIWLIQQGKPKANGQKNDSSFQSTESSELDEINQQLSQLRPITKKEETELRNCFPLGVYYLQKIDYRPQAILCRGKLRTIPEEAYPRIKNNIEQIFDDRFFVLFQESWQGQPFFALVPNPWAKQNRLPQENVFRPGLALILLVITLITTTLVGVEIAGFSLTQLEKNPWLFFQGIAYSFSLILILGCQEISQYLISLRYQIRTTLPYFIPLPFFLGTFGAYIQRRSPLPDRQALFDVGIAGPMAGFLIALPLLLAGLSVSEVVPIADNNNIFNFDNLNPRFSLLLSILTKISLGNGFIADKALDLHPCAVAGYIGLLLTAFNLIPLGQLDGGHIVHAMFGQRMAITIGQVTRVLAVLLAFLHPFFWIWAIVLWLMPVIDQPALNDVTELDSKRDFLGFLALFLLLVIVLPIPSALAEWLNI